MFLGRFGFALIIGGLIATAALGCGSRAAVTSSTGAADTSQSTGTRLASVSTAAVCSSVSTTNTTQSAGVDLDSVPTAAVDYIAEVYSIGGQSGLSDLVVSGVVSRMDEPRWNSPDGKQWREQNEASLPLVYETFYVEPIEVLKGTPKWGTPVAFRVWVNTTEGAPTLAVGDRVVAFGELFAEPAGSKAVYQPADAYWLTGNNYGLWVERGGLYRNEGGMTGVTGGALTLKDLGGRIVSALGATTTVTSMRSQ
jgi:hypothetical protein